MSLVLVPSAIFLLIYFAAEKFHCSEFSVDLRYSHEQFLFRSTWKSDRLPAADIRMAEPRKALAQMPEDPREFPGWLRLIEQQIGEISKTYKNEKKTETVSLYPIFLIGWKWKLNVEMWPKPDFARYTTDAVEANSEWTVEEKQFLEAEWKKLAFKQRDMHHDLQKQLQTSPWVDS